LGDIAKKIALNSMDGELPPYCELRGLYDEYHAPLVKFFGHKLPAGEDPEDMAQQVFIKLVEAVKHKNLNFSRKLIFVIAKNALIDRLRWRKSHRVEKHEMVVERFISCEMPLPDRILEGKQQLDHFFNHLDKLPLRCKQVFLLHRVYNMSQKQVAEGLGISLSTVHKHMMNAMSKLHDHMQNMADL